MWSSCVEERERGEEERERGVERGGGRTQKERGRKGLHQPHLSSQPRHQACERRNFQMLPAMATI